MRRAAAEVRGRGRRPAALSALELILAALAVAAVACAGPVAARAGAQEAPTPFAPYVGDYRTEAGSWVSVFVQEPGGGDPLLVFIDWASRRYGVLHRDTAAHAFFAGPGLMGRSPVEVRAVFGAEGSGPARSLSLSYATGATKRAEREPTHRVEPLVVAHDDVRLPGWLLVPEGEPPHPAVVIVHGGGPVSRRSLLPTALFFVHRGLATLVYDKRGSGEAEGPGWHWFDPLASDVVRAVDVLASHPRVDPERIGLFGASQGGWVAPLAASRSPRVSFLVLQVAPATDVQRRAEVAIGPKLRADGFPEEEVAEAAAFIERLEGFYRGGGDADAYERALSEARDEPWFAYVEAPSNFESLRRFPDRFHPAGEVLRALQIPVLALYGDLDTVVPADVHAPLMYEALRESGSRDFTVVTLPRATHGMAEGETGGRKEAPRLNRFVSGFWGTVGAWLAERGLERPGR